MAGVIYIFCDKGSFQVTGCKCLPPTLSSACSAAYASSRRFNELDNMAIILRTSLSFGIDVQIQGQRGSVLLDFININIFQLTRTTELFFFRVILGFAAYTVKRVI